MLVAQARHILVPTEEAANDLKSKIEGGADFAAVAAEHSKCPSGQEGGDLGKFSQGQMVPEFDKVVFADEVGKVLGPIQTQFGYHLIEILGREEIVQQIAQARHILVSSEEAASDLKTKIESGADFAAVAAEHSSCPSGKQGGDLGEFTTGQMVPEFDKVVFSGEVGKVLGPVQTQFGYHLIEITKRENI